MKLLFKIAFQLYFLKEQVVVVIYLLKHFVFIKNIINILNIMMKHQQGKYILLIETSTISYLVLIQVLYQNVMKILKINFAKNLNLNFVQLVVQMMQQLLILVKHVEVTQLQQIKNHVGLIQLIILN